MEVLLKLRDESRNVKDLSRYSSSFQTISETELKVIVEQEKLYQYCHMLSIREAVTIIECALNRRYQDEITAAFGTWTNFVKQTNLRNMESDKSRWRLHASANIMNDLQVLLSLLYF